MADGVIIIDEPAVTDTQLDVESFGGSPPIVRERVRIGGEARADLAPVDATAGLKVDLGADNDVTNAGTFPVQEDGAALTALQKIDNIAHAGQDVALVEHVPISGQYDDTATGTVTEDQIAPVRITSARALHVAQQGTVTVDGSGVTQPISAVSLPLPSGAATETTLSSIDSALAGTLAVSAASLPLPSGAATAANQSTANSALSAIQTAVELIDDPVATISATPLMRVAIFDASDSQITSFGGGTQYTEDDAAAGNPVGTNPVFVRQDTPATLVSADGDVVAGRATNYGAQYVQIVTSAGAFVDSFGGSGGTSEIDDADFTQATTSGTPAMGVYESTPTTVTDGDLGIVGIDTNRNLKVSIEVDNVGIGGGTQYTEGDTDATITGTALMFEGAADTLVAAPGTAADGLLVNLGSNNDVTVTGTVTANAGTDLNTSALALESGGNLAAIAAAVAGSEMQVDVVTVPAPLNVTGGGTEAAALRVTIANDSTGLISIDDGGNTITVDGTVIAAGAVAHDSADSGSPVKIGGRADTTFQAAVSDGDAVDALFDVYGALRVRPDHANQWDYHADGSTALTDATVASAPGAGLSNYITDIIISNGAATALNAFFEESTTTILGPFYLEAINGRSMHIRFNTPKKVTANTAVTVTTSDSHAHSVDVTGFIAP